MFELLPAISIDEEVISNLAELSPVLHLYATQRNEQESFGDFTLRMKLVGT